VLSALLLCFSLSKCPHQMNINFTPSRLFTNFLTHQLLKSISQGQLLTFAFTAAK